MWTRRCQPCSSTRLTTGPGMPPHWDEPREAATTSVGRISTTVSTTVLFVGHVRKGTLNFCYVTFYNFRIGVYFKKEDWVVAIVNMS